MEKFNSALSTIFFIIWIPLGILLAIVLFLFLSSNMNKTQMTGASQSNFVQGTGGQQKQTPQSGGELQQPQQGGQPIPQGNQVPQQGGQQNPGQPSLQK